MNNIVDYWNHKSWLNQFKVASVAREGFKELRKAVFKNTLQIIKNGEYRDAGEKIVIENHTNENLIKDTIFYDAPPKVDDIQANYTQRISVINADCLESANLLQQLGYNPIVLNMANDTIPGGGVAEGAGAQEENIFRRSNLYVSLYQFSNKALKFDIPMHEKWQYPMKKRTGGIYSPNVTVFRGSENNGYCLLIKPYKIAFVSVAAIFQPKVGRDERGFYLVESEAEITKEKMRTIMRIAIFNHHDSIVLSAFGCGAFCNPPNHIAELFKEVFEELEFKNKMKAIVFAIFDDHNSWRKHNPEGNVLPFVREFC